MDWQYSFWLGTLCNSVPYKQASSAAVDNRVGL